MQLGFMGAKQRVVRIATAIGCGLLCFVISCVSSTGPIGPLVGSYVLESVNDVSLPAPAMPSNACTRVIREGSLILDPNAADARPFFLWEARATETCAGTSVDVGVVARDVGRWAVRSGDVSFDGQSGSYTGKTASTSTSMVVRFQYNGDVYAFRKSP